MFGRKFFAISELSGMEEIANCITQLVQNAEKKWPRWTIVRVPIVMNNMNKQIIGIS